MFFFEILVCEKDSAWESEVILNTKLEKLRGWQNFGVKQKKSGVKQKKFGGKRQISFGGGVAKTFESRLPKNWGCVKIFLWTRDDESPKWNSSLLDISNFNHVTAPFQLQLVHRSLHSRFGRTVLFLILPRFWQFRRLRKLPFAQKRRRAMSTSRRRRRKRRRLYHDYVQCRRGDVAGWPGVRRLCYDEWLKRRRH